MQIRAIKKAKTYRGPEYDVEYELLTRLSSKGFENVHFNPAYDFDFIVGRHHYRYSRFTAAFLSPMISRLQLSDPTITSYSICGASNPSHIE
jgi:hypothetical protein